MTDTEDTMLAVDSSQFRFGDFSEAVKNHHGFPDLQSQNISAMVGVGFLQFRRFIRPTVWRKVKAMRGHDRKIRDSDQTVHAEKELPPAVKELPYIILGAYSHDLRG
jgi:hypothetical protein